MPFTPSTLYYVSSLLNAVSIPGRILFGIQYVDPAVDRISPTPELALGKATAKTAWDMVNGMLTALALLNFQCGRTGGPRTLEEKLIVWANVLSVVDRPTAGGRGSRVFLVTTA